jgi:CelD/BcsL family acetyltransferase involved in cellulose biosynthesis
LFQRLVEQLANEGIEMIDCGAGEDEDKLRWCTQQRQRLHAIVPVTAKGHAYAAALKAKLSAKLHIKQSPKLWSLAKRLRQWTSGLRLREETKSRDSAAPGLQT